MALFSPITLIAFLLFLGFSSAVPLVPQSPTSYLVPGSGTFMEHLSLDFTRLSTFPSSLLISDYSVSASGAPYAHTFDPNLVSLSNSSLTLTVPGGSRSLASIPSAEIATAYDDILYGSIRVVAAHDGVLGTCKGMFFYRSDSQETDIEILHSDAAHNLTGVWFTNQKSDPEAQQTTKQIEATDAGWHEYRTDWLPERTSFFVDGVLKGEFASNVAWEPSSFIVNNWSNGDGAWSAGPPVENSVLRVKSIEGYFNRSGQAY